MSNYVGILLEAEEMSPYRRFQEDQSFRFRVVHQLGKNGIVVHGDDKDLTFFDSSKIRGGTRARYGWGAYFADAAYKCEEYGNCFTFLDIRSFNIIDLYGSASSGNVNFADKLKEYDEINRQMQMARDKLDNARNVRDYDYWDDMVNELKDKLDLVFSDDSEYTMYHLLSEKLQKEPNIRYGELNKWLANNFSSMLGDWMVANLYRDAGVDGFKCDNEYCLFNFKKINANIIKDRDKLIANYC